MRRGRQAGSRVCLEERDRNFCNFCYRRKYEIVLGFYYLVPYSCIFSILYRLLPVINWYTQILRSLDSGLTHLLFN
jgi:hypothetical protein